MFYNDFLVQNRNLRRLVKLAQPVGEDTRLTNNVLIKLVVLSWFWLAQIVVAANVGAQSFDVEPPVIEHEVIESAPAGDKQTFTATVADDDELSQVRFLYRLTGENSFTSLDMNRVSSSSVFTVDLATEPEDARSIEYYIEARDVSGNRTLRGYSFSPLVRAVEVPQQAVTPAAETTGPSFNRKPLYYVAGVVALGALVGILASSSSSSGGSDDMGGGECDDGMCTFTLTINPPGQ